MGWNRARTEYTYARGTLRAIARAYPGICLPYYPVMVWGLRKEDREVTNLWVIAEIKADFDMALSAIGREPWRGWQGSNFDTYKNYGRFQKMVIADMCHIPDYKLSAFGFSNPKQKRGTAYRWMLDFLNVKAVK